MLRILLITIGGLSVVGIIVILNFLPPRHDEPLKKAFLALNQREPEKALEILAEVLKQDPENLDAYSIGLQALLSIGKDETAREWIDQLPSPDSEEELKKVLLIADHLRDSSQRWSLAEIVFLKALKNDPKSKEGLMGLVILYDKLLLHHEANLHRFRLLAIGQHHEEVISLGLQEKAKSDPNAFPENDDPSVKALFAQEALSRKAYEDARGHIDSALKTEKVPPALEVAEGLLYWELKERENAKKWWEKVKTNDRIFCEAWMIRGNWARELGDHQGAAHCAGQVLLQNPHCVEALELWSESIRSIEGEDAPLRKAELLDRERAYQTRIQTFNEKPELKDCIELSEQAKNLGRIEEANAWIRMLGDVSGPNFQGQNLIELVKSLQKLPREEPWLTQEIVDQYPLSDLTE